MFKLKLFFTLFLLASCCTLFAGCGNNDAGGDASVAAGQTTFYDKANVKSVVRELLRTPAEAPKVIADRLGEERPGGAAGMSEEELDAHQQIDFFVDEITKTPPADAQLITEYLNTILAAAETLP